MPKEIRIHRGEEVFAECGSGVPKHLRGLSGCGLGQELCVPIMDAWYIEVTRLDAEQLAHLGSDAREKRCLGVGEHSRGPAFHVQHFTREALFERDTAGGAA